MEGRKEGDTHPPFSLAPPKHSSRMWAPLSLCANRLPYMWIHFLIVTPAQVAIAFFYFGQVLLTCRLGVDTKREQEGGTISNPILPHSFLDGSFLG